MAAPAGAVLFLALFFSQQTTDTILTVITAAQAGGQNVVAALQMTAESEGCAGHGDDGYNVLVGYSCFGNYDQHPNILNKKLNSTAAGRYQFIKSTWDGLKKTLNLPDFSPLSQDLGAIELFRQCGALDDIKKGRIPAAIHKCRRIWASFPGAGYGQGERSMQFLLDAYLKAGGSLAPDFSNVQSGVTTAK